MKFFADTADIDDIRDLAETGLIDGVTTNPSLVAKTGRDFKETVREICAIIDGPVSAEVTATDAAGMIAEGRTPAQAPANTLAHKRRSRPRNGGQVTDLPRLSLDRLSGRDIA